MNFTHKLNEIAALWGARLPASKIARQLGMTKGTVCGLVHRARQQGDPRFPQRPQVFAPRPRREKPVPKPVHDLLSVPPRAGFGKVRLMDLRPNDCRFPVEALGPRGEYFFCGKPKDPRSEAYCGQHQKLCVAGVAYVKKRVA